MRTVIGGRSSCKPDRLMLTAPIGVSDVAFLPDHNNFPRSGSSCRVLKNLIKRVLRQRGYELCRLHEEEKGEVPGHEWMTYREAQLYRGMSFMGQISIAEARFLGGMVRDERPARPIVVDRHRCSDFPHW